MEFDLAPMSGPTSTPMTSMTSMTPMAVRPVMTIDRMPAPACRA